MNSQLCCMIEYFGWIEYRIAEGCAYLTEPILTTSKKRTTHHRWNIASKSY